MIWTRRFFLVILVPLGLRAQDFVPYQKSFFSIISENDAYFNQFRRASIHSDRYYTAGSILSFTSKEYDLSDSWLKYLSYKYDDEKFSRYEVALRQDIYTPFSRSAQVDLSDHPYAGFLGVDLFLFNRRKSSLETIRLELGMVGPASLAQQTQNLIHKITHNPFFKGWNTQIRNEFILNLFYEYTYKYDLLDTKYFGIDMLPTLKVALGNANTFFGGGGRIRFGYNLHSDFGINKINTSFSGGMPYSDKFSFYIFAGVFGSYVARDIFIQGNSFGTPRNLELEHFLYDAELGFAFLYKGFRFAYVATYQSKQFSGQLNGGHEIGSIILDFSF